jgi:GrpB-like predicted nucleotidyltransferase (UPF0157 family)
VRVTDGEAEFLVAREQVERVFLHEPDPSWAELGAAEAARVRAALAGLDVQVQHVGSTSVPDLAAKPVLDLLLTVPDATDESSYAPALVASGYAFHVREPDWHQHRLFKRGTPHFSDHGITRDGVPKVNLHVFPATSDEPRRMLLFRDWLRTHPDDRELYEATKRGLAQREWTVVQDYADAKTSVVHEILRRAEAG